MNKSVTKIIENVVKLVVAPEVSPAVDVVMAAEAIVSKKWKELKREQSVREWLKCYVNNNTGTLVDRDVFWKYLENKDLIERVRRFIFYDANIISETKLVSELTIECYDYCQKGNQDICESDKYVIKGFLVGLICEYRHILMENEELNFRALQYNITNAINSNTEKLMDKLEVVTNKKNVSNVKVDNNKSVKTTFEDKGEGWDNTLGKWRYLKENTPLTDIWKFANGNWFYLDTNGDMLTDSIIDDNGVCYYVDKYGAMAKNTWKAVAKDTVSESGCEDYWWMYFGSDGKAYKGDLDGKLSLEIINGNIYAFDQNGHMISGWIDIDGDFVIDKDEAWKEARYYFGDWNDGAMAVGWKNIKVKTSDGMMRREWFYFDPNGIKQCNVRCRKGQYVYNLGPDGRIVDDNILG